MLELTTLFLYFYQRAQAINACIFVHAHCYIWILEKLSVYMSFTCDGISGRQIPQYFFSTIRSIFPKIMIDFSKDRQSGQCKNFIIFRLRNPSFSSLHTGQYTWHIVHIPLSWLPTLRKMERRNKLTTYQQEMNHMSNSQLIGGLRQTEMSDNHIQNERAQNWW